MNKVARTRAKDPRQEKVRATKESWNKEVSGFIDNIIHYKKYMNGYPSKFNMARGKITQELPIEPSKILGMLSTQYERLAADSLAIRNVQHEYASGVKPKHASNKAKRFLSYLKGPFFGSDEVASKNRYRKNFLSNYADIYSSLKDLNSNILSKDPSTVASCRVLFNKFSEDLTILVGNFNLASEEFNLVSKETINEPAKEAPKAKEEAKPAGTNTAPTQPSTPATPPASVVAPAAPPNDAALPTTEAPKEGVKLTGNGPKVKGTVKTLDRPVVPDILVDTPPKAPSSTPNEPAANPPENTEPTVPSAPAESTTLAPESTGPSVEQSTSPNEVPAGSAQPEPKSEEKAKDPPKTEETKSGFDVFSTKIEVIDASTVEQVSKPELIIERPVSVFSKLSSSKEECIAFIKHFFGDTYAEMYNQAISRDFFSVNLSSIRDLLTAFTYLDLIEKSELNANNFKNPTTDQSEYFDKLKSKIENDKVLKDSVLISKASSINNISEARAFLQDIATKYSKIFAVIVNYRNIFMTERNKVFGTEEKLKENKKFNEIKSNLEALAKLKTILSTLGITKNDNIYIRMILEAQYALKNTNTGKDYGQALNIVLPSNKKMPTKIDAHSLANILTGLKITANTVTKSEIPIKSELFKSAGIIHNTKNYFKKKILEMSFFDKTAPLRLKISEFAELGKKVSDQSMDALHDEFDIIAVGKGIEKLLEVQEKMFKLLNVMSTVAKNIRPNKEQLKDLLKDRYFYDADYSDKDMENIYRHINNKTLRNVL